MSKVEQIESQIRELNSDELSALRRWFTEFDADLWDRQIEVDVRYGKLDSLADEALKDHEDGRSTVL